MNSKNFKNKLEKAIDVREGGDLKKSRKLFETLINDTKDFAKRDLSKDFQLLYTTIKAEYVIQYRLEAKQLMSKALHLGEELLKYDNKNKIGNPMSLRSVSNTLIDFQGYEKAVKYLEKMILLYKDNSARRGEVRAHLAFCFFRSGHVEKASKIVNQAVEEIVQNSSNEKHFRVWHSHALMVKALIFNSKNQILKALKFAKDALEVAEKSASIFRVKQAEEIIEFLEEKK